MPVSEYYRGSGEKVMRSMKKRYGKKSGERVFYATANKRKLNRPGKRRKAKKRTPGRRTAHRRSK
jgi:hypothetical protein